jgi:hypothetical protein
MKLGTVEFLFRAIAPAAQDMAPGSMALCAAERDEPDGTSRSMPIVILKGESEARLRPIEPGFLVGVVETPDCPMLLLGIKLSNQTAGFPDAFSVTVPMHTVDQRSLLRILANADECLYVAMSGALPTLAMGMKVDPSVHELFTTAWDSVAALPLNPEADIDRARELAHALMNQVAKETRAKFSSFDRQDSPPAADAPDAPPPAS